MSHHPMIVDLLLKFFFSMAILLLSSTIREIQGNALVTGTIIGDQCKDGKRSIYYYLLNRANVGVAYGGNGSQVMMWKEGTTSNLGNYEIRFKRNLDLSGCYAQVSGTTSTTGCGASAGPPKNLNLMFQIFDMAFYTVDPLISQHAQPMPFC
ncbi:hypothetical protein NE237_017432 [Protea cynaroides]|uniref:Uncharacterized protein n=1 Tax=Protea cynaroides TaxID=273540 RepID=A0A9Q0K810_9MAGN|nr:hypothetical protein NE237_017432 [Protea cynaroides]